VVTGKKAGNCEKSMKKILTPLLLVFLNLSFFGLVSAAPPGESACIKCHTDASRLKSLFIPPKIDRSEGEG
jgi:hypothetical protein